MTPIRTVGVVGTGVIGASWTGLFLACGLRVLVSDPGPGAEQKLKEHINSIWPTLVKLGLSVAASPSNYEFVGASLGDRYEEVDFVQENAPERLDLKSNLLAEIDSKTRPDVLIASSSSGLPSSQFIDQCSKNPARVLIGHPFNPPHLMPLVEVVPHPGTDKTKVKEAIEFYRSLGKTPIHIRQEIPGFVANRLQTVVCSEAYSLVSRGILSAKDLDSCITNSLGPRWAISGPLISNALGGGGGIEGFKHIIEHLGPASRKWTEDINKHAFKGDSESMAALTASVGEELAASDSESLERQRDDLLIQLFKLKGTSGSCK